MNTFKRKALTSAVLGTLGVAGSAQAIYQDPNNLGQALVYPYYTVQSAGGNAFNTFVSVTNTTTSVKVVKVRFREGKKRHVDRRRDSRVDRHRCRCPPRHERRFVHEPADPDRWHRLP